jgi:hypothetical protein
MRLDYLSIFVTGCMCMTVLVITEHPWWATIVIGLTVIWLDEVGQ